MNAHLAIPIGVAFLWMCAVSASEEVSSEKLVSVNIAGQDLSDALSELSTQCDCAITYTPGLGDLPGPDMLYVAPTPASRAIEIVASAYGLCSVFDYRDNLARVLQCDVAERYRDLIAFGVFAKKVRIENSATSSTVGAEVIGIDERMAAHKAGIREGDVILSYNGIQVPGSNELYELVRRTQSGDRVPVEVLRGSEQISFNVEF